MKQAQARAVYEVGAMRDWLLEQEEAGMSVFLSGLSEKKKKSARAKRQKVEEDIDGQELGHNKTKAKAMDVKAMLKQKLRRK